MEGLNPNRLSRLELGSRIISSDNTTEEDNAKEDDISTACVP